MPTHVEEYDSAIELQRSGKTEEAIERLKAILDKKPDYALVHSALSVFYQKLDQLDAAVEHAEKVAALEPEDPFSFTALSLVCQKAGRLGEAEEAMAQAHRAAFAIQRKAREEQGEE